MRLVRSELQCEVAAFRRRVHRDDTGGSARDAGLDDGESDTARADDDGRLTAHHRRRVGRRSESGGHSAAEGGRDGVGQV